MKRAIPILFVLFSLSGVQAQSENFYLGLRVDGLVGGNTAAPVFPLLGFQVGGMVVESLELRASVSTVLLFSYLQADVLYTRDVSDTLRVYGGVGGDVLVTTFSSLSPAFFVHPTAGAEYRLGGGLGLFGEVQPLFGFTGNPDTGSNAPGLELGRLMLGINFYP